MVDLAPTDLSLYNYSYIVDSNITINLPDNCGWGIRTVHLVAMNALIIQIIGVTKDGSKATIWINCYNINHWTGWIQL